MKKKFVSIVNKSKMNFINFLFIILFSLIQINSIFGERIEILMSNVTTQKVTFFKFNYLINSYSFFKIKEDAYMCTSYKLSDDQNYISNYIFFNVKPALLQLTVKL